MKKPSPDSISYQSMVLCGAGEGNRTLTTSLEGWSSTTELHPHILVPRLSCIVYYTDTYLACQAGFPNRKNCW